MLLRWSAHPRRRVFRYLVTVTMLLTGFSLLHVVLSKSLVYENLIDPDSTTAITYPRDYFLGPCLVHTSATCPDDEINFFLFTRRNRQEAQQIQLNDTWSNLGDTHFRPRKPTKVIVHGYNSDMQLDSLVDLKNQYLERRATNVVAVDWRRLAAGPCYPTAVQHVPHVGQCLAQLVERLRDEGARDIHIIGFSLGAHVPAYCANHLRPYRVARITGLDPAMPLFVTVSRDHKLDPSDAEFVDVFHTNAFVQGKFEASGHVDFYMNGGVSQPGCWDKRNPFGCSHHRAAEYFAESVNSKEGFWGWSCPSFFVYLVGLCPPRLPAVLAGDGVDWSVRGFHLVKTKSSSPYAMGQFKVDPRD